MPFNIVKKDITKITADAVVNAANSSLLGGSGVDGAIHRAAGPELLFECRLLGGCKTGEAKATKGYKMPCRYIIHTVGPVWRGGTHGEPELLYSCYRNSLEIAKEKECESIAFPLISSGIYGYPKDQALKVAVSAIEEFLEGSDMDVTLAVLDRDAIDPGSELTESIRSYLDEHPIPYEDFASAAPIPKEKSPGRSTFFARKKSSAVTGAAAVPKGSSVSFMMADEMCANDLPAFDKLDESFSEALQRMIDERGLTDPQVYKKANIDRRLFSKIRSDRSYRPRKQTALAFAIALELDLEQTRSLLEKAGFALSDSIKSDVIVKYFIVRGQYDIFTINEVLFSFDQSLIGG